MNKKDVIGINAHVPDGNRFERICQVNTKWIRLDFSWAEIEPSKGQFAFTRYDQIVSEAHRRGLSIYAGLGGTPAWAGSGDKKSPPSDASAWSAFVARVVERYKNEIKYWGMWNEPNETDFWSGSEQQYTELILKPGSAAARNVDLSCNIVAPDINYRKKAKWWNWIAEICRNNGKRDFDVFSCHIYKDRGPELVIEALEKGQRIVEEAAIFAPSLVKRFCPWYKSIREVMAENEISDKVLWITEVGWATASRNDEAYVSEETQADYLIRLADATSDVSRAKWLERIFIYDLQDDAIRQQLMGIIAENGTPKKAYSALRDYLA